ncbi:helix-turn-helix transcriptional regulator [Schinkia azotoformans]|uniref:helix-turn-helix transcriptional regulator n=1 Tax=Schinkia azotoformans TaxID=1454 RepID=UPI002DBA2A03|nr:helix-turn-helix transcriptional regulator [Schinkia azotoformans]MEC1723930.1 helix-turn-helix transcriptional regulator [Schinkia azotoformans]
MWGIGKKRTKVGKWIDRHSLSQEDLSQATKISRNTISKICNDPEYAPNAGTIKKIMVAIRKIDPNAKVDDFFNM